MIIFKAVGRWLWLLLWSWWLPLLWSWRWSYIVPVLWLSALALVYAGIALFVPAPEIHPPLR